jgi:hypothetical protein
MLYRHHRYLRSYLLAAALFGASAIGRESMFDICKDRVEGIKNGTETFHGISNETIAQYLYTGPVRGLSSELRKNITTIKTQGMSLSLRLTRKVIVANTSME